MKVVFDHQVFSYQRYGGVSRYICRLASSLNDIEGVESKIIAPFHFNEHAANLPKGIVQGIKVPRPPKSKNLFLNVNNFIYRQFLKRFSPDVVHETYYWRQPNLPHRAVRIITCYDMIHEKFGNFFSKKDDIASSKLKSLKSADHIICISESTRRDLIELYEFLHNKVSVVYLGYDQLIERSDFPQQRPKQTSYDRPYLLYVGARSSHKNFENFFKAYAMSKFLMSSFLLVAFGGGKFTPGEKRMFEQKGIAPTSVIHVDGNDVDLAEHYINASVFVYPSFYEGFGIPPLEAFSCGCPVACSNTSSIPEVVGDACMFFDPREVEQIEGAITALILDKELRERCVQKGRLRSEVFNWHKCASQTHDVYRRFI